MIYKTRQKPQELLILELLNQRMKLGKSDLQHYLSLRKGYEGEIYFDSFTEKLSCDCLILNDLLLEVNSTVFQIDSLIIMQGKIHFFEVKTFSGDYYFEAGQLFKRPKFEVTNPLHQMSRSKSLLRQLLLNLGYHLEIHASVVFTSDDFYLYQAPLDKPIIFPNQIQRHIDTLNSITTKLTEKYKKLADQLLALNITDSPFKQIPVYSYEQLQKGIICSKCQSFQLHVGRYYCVCSSCGNRETVVDTVLRSIRDLQYLFPEKTITTNLIHDWCQSVPKRRVRSILQDQFYRIGEHRWTYYKLRD